MFVVRSNNNHNFNPVNRAIDSNHDHLHSLPRLFLISILIIVTLLLQCSNAASIGQKIVADSSQQQSDSWTQSDMLCDEIEKTYSQVCECVIESDKNRLKLVCDGLGNTKSTSHLFSAFSLLNKHQQDHLSGQPEELVLSNLTHFNAAQLPNVTISTLRIFNSPELRLIESIEQVPSQMANSLKTLEIVKTRLGQDVFYFIRKFEYLNTVLMSDLQLGSTLSTSALRTGHCTNHLYRMALNHQCSPMTTPLTTIEPRVFTDLCHVAVLELSCLGLTTIQPESLYMSAPPSGGRISKIYIDLSFNNLSSISPAVSDSIGIQTRRQIDTIYLNADHNPVQVLNQTLVTSFLAHGSKNRIRAWQGPEETVLDCGNCANQWLTSASVQFETYCIKQSQSQQQRESILLDNETAFSHCK